MDVGPIPLTHDNISVSVPSKHGVYLLTKCLEIIGANDKMIEVVCYVGRAVDLKQRLRKHCDKHAYFRFYYKNMANDTKSFIEECRLYHLYGGKLNLENLIHPARPRGKRVRACNKRACAESQCDQ